MSIDISKIKFNEQGLVPAIVQDIKKNVLMLAYMNEEALSNTLTTGTAWYWSRSRKELWHKGDTSGHFQKVKAVQYDCDGDTILLTVEQEGVACHTGSYTCFDERYLLEGNVPDTATILDDIFAVIKDRQQNPQEGSYTNYLFTKGEDKILKKIGEEAVETVIAAKGGSADELIYEMSDTIYHLLVLLAEKNLTPTDLYKELAKRHGGGPYHKFTGKTGIRPAD